MYLCLRVDLDYVPWDTPDAREFGHGEPAVVLRLLDLAAAEGMRFHFFASTRSLRALPAVGEAVLNAGHPLDWLCKHPHTFEARCTEAMEVWTEMGETPLGFASKGPWPESALAIQIPSHLRFISAPAGKVPHGLRHFPVDTKPDREAVRGGANARRWSDAVKAHLRQVASVYKGATIVVRPQVLAKFDPHLYHVKELVELAQAIDLRVLTLRDLMTVPQ